MNQKDTLYLLKFDVATLRHFKQRCYGCHEPMHPSKGFVFHHIKYLKDEKSWKDFKEDNTYGLKQRLAYNRYLMLIVKANPKRFLLLCGKCHHFLERLKKFGDTRLKRLLKARRMSR